MINANTPYCPPHASAAGPVEPARVANVKRAVPALKVGRKGASSTYRYASDKQCPLCGGRLIRTPRRLQDRLWSLVEPMMRFRCDRFSCQWVGNISGRGTSKPAVPGTLPRLRLAATLGAVLIAGAGVVALALFVTTDVFESATVRSTAMPSSEWDELTHRLGVQSGALSTSAQDGSTRTNIGQRRR